METLDSLVVPIYRMSIEKERVREVKQELGYGFTFALMAYILCCALACATRFTYFLFFVFSPVCGYQLGVYRSRICMALTNFHSVTTVV